MRRLSTAKSKVDQTEFRVSRQSQAGAFLLRLLDQTANTLIASEISARLDAAAKLAYLTDKAVEDMADQKKDAVSWFTCFRYPVSPRTASPLLLEGVIHVGRLNNSPQRR